MTFKIRRGNNEIKDTDIHEVQSEVFTLEGIDLKQYRPVLERGIPILPRSVLRQGENGMVIRPQARLCAEVNFQRGRGIHDRPFAGIYCFFKTFIIRKIKYLNIFPGAYASTDTVRSGIISEIAGYLGEKGQYAFMRKKVFLIV